MAPHHRSHTNTPTLTTMDFTKGPLKAIVAAAQALDAAIDHDGSRGKAAVTERRANLNKLIADLEGHPELALADFEPLNGRIAVERVSLTQNVWVVKGIAANWPMEHHPIAIGDMVIPQGTDYLPYIPGTIAWLKPGEVMAIKRDKETYTVPMAIQLLMQAKDCLLRQQRYEDAKMVRDIERKLIESQQTT